MLQLNLLPPEEKINLAYIIRARAAAAIGGGLGVVLMIFMVLLLPTVFFLALQKSDVIRALESERESQERSGISALSAEIHDVNRLAAIISKRGKEPAGAYRIFEDVFQSAPPEVRFQNARFRLAEREITLEGFSPTRVALLEFIEALEKNTSVDKVSSPVTNIIKEADIKFSLAVKLK